MQRGGNLGERINHVNEELIQLGFERQLYIGIDCPSLDVAYLERAAAALGDHDTVSARRPTAARADGCARALASARRAALEHERVVRGVASGLRRGRLERPTLPRLKDIDTLGDLVALRTDLLSDPRPARRALVRWLTAQTDLGR